MALRAGLAALRVQVSTTLVRPTVQVLVLVQPVVMATLAFFIHDTVDPATRFFVVLGSGMSGMWVATAFSSAGDLERERFEGTIQPVMASPTPLWVVAAGRACGALVLSALPVGVSLLFSALMLDMGFPPAASVPAVVLAVAVFGLGCHAVGVVLSHLFLLSRRTTVLQNFLEWPVLVVSGVLIPIAALPHGLQVASGLLPMRRAAEAAAAAFSSGTLLVPQIGASLAVSSVYMACGAVLSRVIERRVRASASLEVA